MLQDNGKQNQNEFYAKKYQKHVVCNHGYKLACVDNKFSKPFKSYLDEGAVYIFINKMVEETRYRSDMMKRNSNKELAMTEKDLEDFRNSTKCWICYHIYIDGDDTKRDHCHVTGKYIASAHRDHNIKVKLNNRNPVLFHNIKN